MAATRGPPLDERVHYRPEIIAWWVNEMGGKPMDENMIHRYLTESPFFDYTTKNGLIFTQARTNHAADQLVRNRREFEDQLSKQNGTEYMIVGEPQPVTTGSTEGGAKNNGIYVIRKQDRKRNRAADGGINEELTTLGTYYVVGEMMYQARSVGDIVGNRLLAAATSLSKFYDEAAQLPTFSPTTGYSYTIQQPSSKQNASAAAAPGSPSRLSRDESIAPTGVELPSIRSGSVVPDSQSVSIPTTVDTTDARLLEQTMNMLDFYGDEFMDENPIIGEPGHFSFTSSTAAVMKKRKAAEDEAAAAEKLRLQHHQRVMASSSQLASPKAEKPPSPPAIMTEAKALKEREKDRRGSKSGDKLRRKKSRVNAQTPTTPSSSVSAFAPPSTTN